MIKNKKGDVPVTVLVIGIIAVCALAIFSFIISDKFFVNDNSLGIELFEQIHSDIEKFEFYRNIGDSDEIAAGKINAEIQGSSLNITKEEANILIEYKYIIKPK